ncbi:hypothetical protein LH428_06625, partial [Laribacter hongkongensis]|uniref:hypothetical protein n=1 Tax=Laribacter hongkongensis TaxID=168471 RepID=UPI001EFE60A0
FRTSRRCVVQRGGELYPPHLNPSTPNLTKTCANPASTCFKTKFPEKNSAHPGSTRKCRLLSRLQHRVQSLIQLPRIVTTDLYQPATVPQKNRLPVLPDRRMKNIPVAI